MDVHHLLLASLPQAHTEHLLCAVQAPEFPIPFPLSSMGWPQQLLAFGLVFALVSVLSALVSIGFYFCSFIVESGQSARAQYQLFQVLCGPRQGT